MLLPLKAQYVIQPLVTSATPTKRRIRDGTVAKIKCTDFIEVCINSNFMLLPLTGQFLASAYVIQPFVTSAMPT